MTFFKWNISVVLAALSSLPLSATSAIAAENQAQATENVAEVWEERMATFRRIQAAEKKRRHNGVGHMPARNAAALVALLRKEAWYVAAGNALSETYTEYYAELIAEVANLETMASAQVLLMPSVLATGGIASRGVAAAGERILPTVMAQLRAPEGQVDRIGLLMVLRDMADSGRRAPLSSQARDQIRSVAMTGLGNSNPMYQAASVGILGKFSDDEARAIVMTKASAGNEVPAAVRAMARSALGLPPN